MSREYDIDLPWPMKDVAAMLAKELEGDAPSLTQLQEWARKADKNNFPLPERTIGRFNFYKYEAVRDWVILWRRATKGMGRKDLNNGKR
jgi:hypothetical protein